MGEHLNILSVKELQQLEQQLENALKLIRSRKVKLKHKLLADFRANLYYIYVISNAFMTSLLCRTNYYLIQLMCFRKRQA